MAAILRTSMLGVGLLVLPLLLAWGCDGGNMGSGDGDGDGGSAPFSVPPGCDPDGVEACPSDWFVCVEDDAGNKHCEGQVPAAPDNGDWSCEVVDDALECVGDHMADSGGAWECVEDGDEVTCTTPVYDPATGEGDDGSWSCAYEDEFLVCEAGEYGGEEPPEDDGPPAPGGGIDFCFFDEENPDGPAMVHGEYTFETLGDRHAIHVTLKFNQAFVDNTYGVNSSSGYDHTFRDLVGSDKAEVAFIDGNGDEVLRARFDYISESDDAPTGYDCLGATDGDGRMIEGDEAYILDATSSLDRNLNERDCVFLEDSPTMEECPEWDFLVVYEMWIDAEAFGSAGFRAVMMTEVHASPSRTDNTVPVVPGPCP